MVRVTRRDEKSSYRIDILLTSELAAEEGLVEG